MKDPTAPNCAACQTRACRNGADCFGTGDEHGRLYEQHNLTRWHQAASAIEARHYCREPRLRETMLLAHELELRKLGLAFCVGLAAEAQVIHDILAREFDVVSVCCKVGGIGKAPLNIEQIDPAKYPEVMCNPLGQAQLLNQAGTELNILCGLCVGHDALFSRHAQAPVTTLIAKDRVLAHNPIGAVYSRYIRRTMLPEE